jgi:hypothetical protein
MLDHVEDRMKSWKITHKCVHVLSSRFSSLISSSSGSSSLITYHFRYLGISFFLVFTENSILLVGNDASLLLSSRRKEKVQQAILMNCVRRVCEQNKKRKCICVCKMGCGSTKASPDEEKYVSVSDERRSLSRRNGSRRCRGDCHSLLFIGSGKLATETRTETFEKRHFRSDQDRIHGHCRSKVRQRFACAKNRRHDLSI